MAKFTISSEWPSDFYFFDCDCLLLSLIFFRVSSFRRLASDGLIMLAAAAKKQVRVGGRSARELSSWFGVVCIGVCEQQLRKCAVKYSVSSGQRPACWEELRIILKSCFVFPYTKLKARPGEENTRTQCTNTELSMPRKRK